MIERFFNYWVQLSQVLRKRFAWLGYILVFVAISYLAFLLFNNWEQLNQIPWQKYWAAGLISLLLYLLSLLPQVVIWIRMMSFHHKSGWQDFKIFFQGMLLRRIPGGIWHWVGRVSIYSGTTNIPPKTVLYANFWEWILVILIGVGIIFAGESIHDVLGPIAVIGSLISWGLAIGLAYKWFPQTRSRSKRLLESIGWITFYSFAWIMGGLIVYVFSRSTDATNLNILSSIWIWAVTGTLSWVLIIVPSGLGVREITLTTLLQPYMSTSNALVIAIAIRLVFLIADILWGGLGWLIGHYMHKYFSPKSPDLPISNEI